LASSVNQELVPSEFSALSQSEIIATSIRWTAIAAAILPNITYTFQVVDTIVTLLRQWGLCLCQHGLLKLADNEMSWRALGHEIGHIAVVMLSSKCEKQQSPVVLPLQLADRNTAVQIGAELALDVPTVGRMEPIKGD